MKILIASGTYPPDIGGTAQYARNLYETWKRQGHQVKVAAYRWERAFPAFLRHILFFSKVIRKGWDADMIIVLDTWSAGVPTMYACKLMRKQYLLRLGGDLLWETYTERTGDMVLLKDFYRTCGDKLSRKERAIRRLGRKVMHAASKVVFSTEWQRTIFRAAYDLSQEQTAVVENYCGEREVFVEPENRMFVAGTRPLKWKNIDFLKESMDGAQDALQRLKIEPVELDCGKAVYDSFLEKIRRSYAVILVSLGDASPNMIWDAVRCGVPFIVTRETGIAHHIKDAALFVDPKNKKEIVDAIVWLSDPQNRAAQAKKVQAISYMHSWDDIADELRGLSVR